MGFTNCAMSISCFVIWPRIEVVQNGFWLKDPFDVCHVTATRRSWPCPSNLHCVNSDGPFEGENVVQKSACQTDPFPLAQCSTFDGDGTRKQILLISRKVVLASKLMMSLIAGKTVVPSRGARTVIKSSTVTSGKQHPREEEGGWSRAIQAQHRWVQGVMGGKQLPREEEGWSRAIQAQHRWVQGVMGGKQLPREEEGWSRAVQA